MDDFLAMVDELEVDIRGTPAAAARKIQVMGTFERRGQLKSVEDVDRYVRAGRATITLVSRRTKTRFTYKVSKPEKDDGPVKFFVGLMNGPDNQNNYVYMGCIKQTYNGEYFTGTKASKVSRDAPSYKAFEWFWQKIITNKRSPDEWGVDVWHEGSCCRCGRKLTVPESVEDGIGPECRKRMV